MGNDEMEILGDNEPTLTPDDGFRLVVRLMRRYIERCHYRSESLRWKLEMP
ncbi:MAG: hypothetical protein ACYDBB_21050 [Armatimonadota bacterium]